MSAAATRPTIVVAHPSPDLYGSDRVLLESVSGLIAAGYHVITALPEEGPLAPALRERGSDVVFVQSPVLRKSALKPIGLVKLIAEAVRSIPAAWRLLRGERPALLLVNTITVPLWFLVGRLLRIPVVCHVHEAEQSLNPWLRRLLYLPLLVPNALVVNSRFALGVLAQSWRSLARRGTVVYNGVPGPQQPAPPRDHLTPPVRLLFVGRLSPRKGPQVALRALERLLAEQPGRYRLALLGAVFPGYEWFEQELRDFLTQRGLSESVEFLGFDPDIWAHLAASDIVLVPSTVDEPFGNTAVEAMLALRPLVVSDTSGLREAAAGYASARMVVPDDPEAIVSAVRELAGDWPAVIADSAADRQVAIDRHAPQAYQQAFTAALEKVIKTPVHRTTDHS